MDNKLVLIILALFLPPIAVYLKCGPGKNLIINILLCLLFYVPGMARDKILINRNALAELPGVINCDRRARSADS